MAQALCAYKKLTSRMFLSRWAGCFLMYCAVKCLYFFNCHLIMHGSFPQLVSRWVLLDSMRTIYHRRDFAGGVGKRFRANAYRPFSV